MINLCIPWICLLLVVLLMLAIWEKWYKLVGICFVILFLANWYWQVFSFGCWRLVRLKNPDCFRVMTWNVCCSDSTATGDVYRLITTIIEEEADVVFLTEYGESIRPELDSMLCRYYPYKGNIANWITWSNFYSRVPVDTCMRIGGEDDGYLFRYDVWIADCSLRLYCLHLQSNNLVNGEMFYPDSIEDKGGIIRYLENYKVASKIRHEQAKLIVSDFSEVPSIVMGDMNDVCGSSCMEVFANAGLREAWREVGFGYGATIHEPLPYRIDHIMCSDGLHLKSIKKVDANGLSDHDALVSDFEIR